MVWDYDFHMPWRYQDLEEYPKTITLPKSGKVVIVIREATGDEAIFADRMLAADQKMNLYALTAACASQTCQFDGQQMVYEDVRHLPIIDLMALMAEILGTGGVPSESSSPDSSSLDLRRAN